MTEVLLSGLRDGDAAVSLEDFVSPRRGAHDSVSVAALIESVDLDADTAYCTVVSVGGAYSASIPLIDLIEGGSLAFWLDDGPMPEARGGPVRLTVNRGRTLCWNVKNVGVLRFTATQETDSVPKRPKH